MKLSIFTFSFFLAMQLFAAVSEEIITSPLPCRQYVINSEIDGDTSLVIFLHGQGQRGNDNSAQIAMGKDQLIAYCLENKLKVVVIFPQCPETDMWMELQRRENALPAVKPSPSLMHVLDLTEAKAQEFNAAQTYITGFSMGGFGTWLAAGCRPELFDAAIPLCGAGDLDATENLLDIPIYTAHGTADDIVPVFCSRLMVNAIWNAGGEKVIYREMPDVGHDCWTEIYNSPQTWKWLFAQRRQKMPVLDMP